MRERFISALAKVANYVKIKLYIRMGSILSYLDYLAHHVVYRNAIIARCIGAYPPDHNTEEVPITY